MLKEIKMANYRRGRINDAVAKELAIALGNVREPKVNNNFVSITRAEVAPDLKYVIVFFVFQKMLLLRAYITENLLEKESKIMR